MPSSEAAYLELLAEIDAVTARLRAWGDAAPAWTPAATVQALVRRLLRRAESLRVRLEAPLVVATLGGTGTGKSTLVNALAGAEVVSAGRSRPTTTRPTLICRPQLTPEMLAIDPAQVEVVHSDLPALADLVLLDCPDPDTTEDTQSAATNLARLRAILPHCDVILVTATQQKYRSARVSDELAAAASGARLVFVQTHADCDADIRDDWRRVLDPGDSPNVNRPGDLPNASRPGDLPSANRPRYATGEIFYVDSAAALATTQAGQLPHGEFARLQELLTRQLAGTTGNRIRRANFLDLVADTLTLCAQRVDGGLPAVEQVEAAIEKQRSSLAAQLAHETRDELITNRRAWEARLLSRAAARWGLSPFALVLRLSQGLGGLLARGVLLRARTPAQMALWGAMEGARSWQQRRQRRRAEQAATTAASSCWDPAELRGAAVILEGFAIEAGLDRQTVSPAAVAGEAEQAAAAFAAEVSGQLDTLIDRLAARNTGWFTRWRYEAALLTLLGLILYRLAKNFFWDSWLAPQPAHTVFGLEFYGAAAFWLLLWCIVLFWAFSMKLRRGLRHEIGQLALGWAGARPALGVFAHLENQCRRARQFRKDLEMLRQHVAELRDRMMLPEGQLGHRR